MRLGYARISKDEQDRALQLDALTRAGCDRIFEETGSRKNFTERPSIQELMRNLRQGDELVVWALDRFGGNLREILEMVELVHKAGAQFVSLQERIDTTTASGTLFFHLSAAYAQFERSRLIERTVAGLEAARARGRKGGRMPLPDPVCRAIAAVYADRTLEVGDFCRKHRISRTTFYKYAAQFKAADEQKKLEAVAPMKPSRDRKAAPAREAHPKARRPARRAAG